MCCSIEILAWQNSRHFSTSQQNYPDLGSDALNQYGFFRFFCTISREYYKNYNTLQKKAKNETTNYINHQRWNVRIDKRSLWNRPLPSSKNPHFQNEARCTTFLVKMSFICMRMKNDFLIKSWTPTLVLKQKPWGTRKWPISDVISQETNGDVTKCWLLSHVLKLSCEKKLQ